MRSSYDETQKAKNLVTNDDQSNDAINRLIGLNDNNAIKDPWVIDALNSYAARLQGNQIVDQIEQKQRRNDTAFLGKYLLLLFFFLY